MTLWRLVSMIPKNKKSDLHFWLTAHGRVGPRCRGGAKSACEAGIEITARSVDHPFGALTGVACAEYQS